MTRTWSWVVFAAALTVGAAPAFAGDGSSATELGILAGAGQIDRTLHGDESQIGPVVGLGLNHWFCDNWNWATDLTYGWYDTLYGSGDLLALTLRTGPELYLSKAEKKWRWFLAPAVGLTSYDFGDEIDENRGLISVGLGQRIQAGVDSAVRWQLRAERTVGDEVFDDEAFNLQFLLGYAWGVGGKMKDRDADGVIDCRDGCDGTPAGAATDAKGCPSDEDIDGVLDGLDKCPGTLKGCKIDAVGCPIDSDGDGVIDCLDKCPGTPKGVKVDAVGCPVDSDGDGVFDGLDKCPGTPKGCKVDASGCPLDTDGDGVIDCQDKCPGTPKGVKVDANGCPPVEPPKPAPLGGKKTLVLEGVLFDYDKATLKPEGAAVLDEVAASLRDWPDVSIEIAGHTDSRGTDAYNLKLSQSRANTVRDYLVAKGIAASRLAAKGYGESRPVADNKTDEGRAKNRRVELTRTN